MSQVKQSRPRRPGSNATVTVNEAAFVAGLSKKTINQAIDRGEVRSRTLRPKSGPAARVLGGPELVYLRVHNLLSSPARKALYKQLSNFNLETIPPVIDLEGAVKLDIREPLTEVRSRLEELARIGEQVEENSAIRGGEPVFRGTRIPVHMIADFLQQGIVPAEILEDYPALAEESLAVARRYAELYPPRGRPKQAPWRNRPPSRVFHPAEPDG